MGGTGRTGGRVEDTESLRAPPSWPSSLSCLLLGCDRCLSGRQPRDGNAERRRADVVEADLLEKLNRVGIAAVLAADAELDVFPRAAPLRNGDLDELADAGLVDRRERVFLHDLELGVVREKRARVVARHSEA